MLRNKINKLISLGVHPEYKTWEIFITRRVTIDAIIAGFNVGLTFIIFPLFDIYYFQFELAFMFFISLAVLIVNRYGNYITAAYLFHISGIIFLTYVNLKLGINSYVIIFFFPLVLGFIHLFSRKEIFIHLVIILSCYFVSIAFIALAFMSGYQSLQLTPQIAHSVKVFSMFLGMITTLIIFSIISFQTRKQEELIKKMLREKEILLAEVYHRVKNNMNIVTSLLNIKKNISNSTEVKDALESCRNRVYSMALVHGKFFSNENISQVNFGEYTAELLGAIKETFGFPEGESSNSLRVDFCCDEINLGVSQAIPCGLIINELITNAFKHANPKSGILHLQISIRKNLNSIELIVKDNGAGFNPESSSNTESMGYELVKSLCEQLDATLNYKINEGSEFTINFERSLK